MTYTYGQGHGYALEAIEFARMERGTPLVDCHRHLASEYTITEDTYSGISDGRHLDKKWAMMDALRRQDFYLAELPLRLKRAISRMRNQGVEFCRTYAEVDAYLGTRVVETMLEAKRAYRNIFALQVAAYPFQGIGDRAKLKRAEHALEMADVLGCLPSRGRRDVFDADTSRRNMHTLFGLAYKYGKPIDLQIDQNNDPDEQESEILIRAAETFRDKGYNKTITATHCISLAARGENYRRWIISKFQELDIRVVVCPSAALGMKQPSHKRVFAHNSIAPVTELVEAGVIVGIGSDNVADLYEPFTLGDIREETYKMLSAIRWTGPIGAIADMITVNGRKIMGI